MKRQRKAPTGFAGVKWLLNADEVKAIRPKARMQDGGDLFEAMEWLGRPAAVSYGFQNGLFIIAIVTLSNATEETLKKRRNICRASMEICLPRLRPANLCLAPPTNRAAFASC